MPIARESGDVAAPSAAAAPFRLEAADALVAIVSVATRSMAAAWLWIVPRMIGQVFLRP
jgi:hypothetical protein